jgi:2-octaprenylphenol hydroxylase
VNIFMSQYDVIIVGAGIVGATAALALAKKTSLRIALLDSKNIACGWQENQTEGRVSAITLASQRIFQRLQVWDAISAKRVSPYKKMRVWDAHGDGEVEFDCAKLNTAALGYIIEDTVLRDSLLEALETKKNIHVLAPVELLSLRENNFGRELTTAHHGVLQAKLIIAADGANSWLRDAAGIRLKTRAYEHDAIVATVKTTEPHAQTARQRFLASGPLAFLPLSNACESSIVWSATSELARELLACDDENFRKRLASASGNELGEIEAVTRRQSFSLQMRHADQYVKSGLALIGDAAHTLHPLAGQGVNLGLLDAVALVDVIASAHAKQRDYASFANLRRYERWRKGDNTAMLAFVALIKNLFASDLKPVKLLRNTGLNLTNKTDFVKNFLAEYAAGNRNDLPELARA